MSQTISTPTAILGAGPAGMAAARELTRAGRACLVLEREAQVGGLARTVEQDGFRFDLGSHRFFTRNPRLESFVRELLGDELLGVRRTSRILFRGRFFDYPPSFWNAFSGLGPLTSARILAAYLRERLRPDRPSENLEQWMRSQFGSVMYEIFFKTYSEKVWGLPCDQISEVWAGQRIRGMSLLAALRQAVWPSDEPPTSMIDRFLYPARGIGRICEKIAEQLPEPVRLQTRVTRLAAVSGGWRIGAKGPAGPFEVSAEKVISTLPLTDFIRIAEPVAPDAVQKAASELGFRDLILVAVMFDRPPVSRESWLYFPDPALSFGRFHEPANWSPEMCPPGKTCVVFDVFCFRTDPVWSLPDEELMERVVSDLERTGLAAGLRRQVLGFRVVRAEKAYPLHRLGFERPLRLVQSHLDSLPGLWSIGREGLFSYLNIDHALESGILAAENVAGAGHDIGSMLRPDRNYLEGGGGT